MLIFLYGEDTYRSREKLREIVSHYKETHKSGLNLKYFDGKTLDFQDFQRELQIMPMFQEKKFFILSNVLSNQEFKDSFKTNAEKFIDSGNIILFYEETGKPAKDAFFTFLEKKAKCQEFAPLTSQKLKNWLNKEFDKIGAKTDPLALEMMVNFVGNDLWQLSNEVQKLAAFKQGGRIETKDVNLFIKPKIETDIFRTIDAIAVKDKKQALKLLHRHLEKGDNPLYLLSMINYQFRNIISLKDLIEKGKPLASLKLHPYVVRKTCQQAQKFTFDELKKIYQKIFQADYGIKNGKIDSNVALDLLIAEL
ncbi:MAG: DNA polymerase III subunit delta [Candidatus Nealsonbacteria bacterium]|nr:DNA polymerase III subunit delta [Candidatus Nealsonbacteria bacterium]